MFRCQLALLLVSPAAPPFLADSEPRRAAALKGDLFTRNDMSRGANSQALTSAHRISGFLEKNCSLGASFRILEFRSEPATGIHSHKQLLCRRASLQREALASERAGEKLATTCSLLRAARAGARIGASKSGADSRRRVITMTRGAFSGPRAGSCRRAGATVAASIPAHCATRQLGLELEPQRGSWRASQSPEDLGLTWLSQSSAGCLRRPTGFPLRS